jgi:hypothetical protein
MMRLILVCSIACVVPISSSTQQPQKHIQLRIGLITTTGGAEPSDGASIARGVRLGAAESRQTAQLFGDDVQLFEAAGAGATAVASADRLVSSNKIGILIGTSDVDAEALSRFSERHHIIFLNAASRSQSLRSACNRYTFTSKPPMRCIRALRGEEISCLRQLARQSFAHSVAGPIQSFCGARSSSGLGLARSTTVTGTNTRLAWMEVHGPGGQPSSLERRLRFGRARLRLASCWPISSRRRRSSTDTKVGLSLFGSAIISFANLSTWSPLDLPIPRSHRFATFLTCALICHPIRGAIAAGAHLIASLIH